MRASVIIPAYIVDDEVDDCYRRMMESLGQALEQPAETEIILVENGSYRCGNILRPHPHVHYTRPLGCSRSQNLGLALATGDYLCIVSVDVVFKDPNWLNTLINEYQRVGPGILSPDDQGRTGVWEESWYAVWMTDQQTFRRVGYLDERLNYLYGDQDYSIRMAKAGFKVQRTGAVQVDHSHERSTLSKMHYDAAAEEAIMLERYGCYHFREWVAMGRPNAR